ncbi:type II toxin-antitoxin system PemK/MazF family toxin [Desulfuribacillus alkaliarsenatis]|uniref:Type II toxin-antitoxin system PemK/MazF family toxin n=1 Tax=Desulfuribacillus alkaliarsenatis TaxID=766136 RepID=A0A1E5G2V1_9FIRM|nr:type II toxin-antitoxin system PemK/MazF family toxin [Desulfuribacillus alkaliarsenatis]OEF97227.1 hypothetical protein BHF68_14790 [Desulfuribacillus alkaliarsenatis]
MTELKIKTSDKQKIKLLCNQVYQLLNNLVDDTNDNERLEKIQLYLEWLKVKTNKVKEEPTFELSSIPDLRRRDVILVDLGFNIGDEFGGQHTSIVLRNSFQSNKRVLILPITSQEPKNKNLSIYVKIGKIKGLTGDKFHWANIFNIISISKQRVICPPKPKTVSNRIMTRINGAINSQISYRMFDKDNKM